MIIQKSYKNNQKSFHVIPTPIGNLGDITLRTIEILRELDVLYCEDTRVTVKLLNYLEIKKTLRTYTDYNFEKEKKHILDLIESGKKVGIVSDAGMPCISDPGYQLLEYLKENNINIEILPGPSAFVLPMVYAGFASMQYTFWGFISKNKAQAKRDIAEICQNKYNTIIYESPHQLIKTLEMIGTLDNERKVLVARELTKIYEEYVSGEISEIIEYFKENKPRGEFIIIVEQLSKQQVEFTDEYYLKEVKKAIKKGRRSKDAIREVAFEFNISKNELYQKYLEANKEK